MLLPSSKQISLSLCLCLLTIIGLRGVNIFESFVMFNRRLTFSGVSLIGENISEPFVIEYLVFNLVSEGIVVLLNMSLDLPICFSLSIFLCNFGCSFLLNTSLFFPINCSLLIFLCFGCIFF